MLAVAQDADGAIFGVPIAAYGIGLHYNRAMFEEAGLDPDAPPTTWDEVREAAAAISEATGQAGFAQMSQDNTGGLDADDAQLRLRWPPPGGDRRRRRRDDRQPGHDRRPRIPPVAALGGQLDGLELPARTGRTINQAFAAGQVGMYMGGSDVYNSLVTENGVDPATYGLTVIPLEGDRRRRARWRYRSTPCGPTPSDAERDAAVKWIDFFYMGKLTNEEAAVADAEALAATTPRSARRRCRSSAPSSSPSPTPGWPSLVNVPQEQMASFKDSILDQPLIPEPPAHTQEMYAILDTVVQTVLTEEDADIAALLAQADADVTALVEAAG